MTILPATLDLKVAPYQVLHFLSKTHTADENGIVLNVPYDAAKAMIDDPAHPATEATAEQLAVDPEVFIVAETQDSIDVFTPAGSIVDADGQPDADDIEDPAHDPE